MTPIREKAMRKKINEMYVAHLTSDVAFVGTKKQCDKFVKDLPYVNSYIVNSLEDFGYECYSTGSDDGYQQGYEMGQD